jgi:hypothetical protein
MILMPINKSLASGMKPYPNLSKRNALMPQIAEGSEHFLLGGLCEVTRVSVASNRVQTRIIHATPQQFAQWRSGFLVQDAFPNLSPEEREFLITGMSDEEWHAMWAEDDDEQ